MKNIILTTMFLAGAGAMASAETGATRTDPHYHDLIVQSFGHAGFNTRVLASADMPDKQMRSSDYRALVDKSFRRAGMNMSEPAHSCDMTDSPAAETSALC